MMKYIATNKAPQAIGPYSQGLSFGELIFTSGQIALKPDGSMCEDDIEVQTRQVLQNLSEVLQEGESSLDRVLKTTIFLSDMGDFARVNDIYAEFFGSHKPARSTVAVKSLPKNALVEIEAVAVKG